MADIEKVIKGLQAHADGCGYRSHHCDDMDCPYRYGDESCDIEEMCRDALALLKEHIKTKVVFRQYDGSIETECSNCGQHLDKAYSRCPRCQKELDWNG